MRRVTQGAPHFAYPALRWKWVDCGMTLELSCSVCGAAALTWASVVERSTAQVIAHKCGGPVQVLFQNSRLN